MIKAFSSSFWCTLYGSFNHAFLIGGNADDDESYSGIYKPVDRYHVPLPSVETGCFPYFLTNSCRNRSATSIVLLKEIWIPRIILSIGSIAIHSHTNSLRTLSKVSSIINSDNTFFLFWDILLGLLYRWIQFQIETWFLLINADKNVLMFF